MAPAGGSPRQARKNVHTYKEKSIALHPALGNYFNRRLFSDLTVVAPDGRSLYCHQVILSACSKRFANMLEQGSVHGEELPVWGVDSNALEQIIKLFYSGECIFCQDTVVPILDAAQRLEVPGIVAACDAYIKDTIDVLSCCTFLSQADRLKMEELSGFCLQYIGKRFEEVIQSEGFVAVEPPTLMQILKHSKSCQSDLNIFKAAWTWVISDVKHVQYLEDILKIVKVPDITFQELIKMGASRVPPFPMNLRGINMGDLNFPGVPAGHPPPRLDLSQTSNHVASEELHSPGKSSKKKSPVPQLALPANLPGLQMQLLQQAMLSGAGFPLLVSVCPPISEARQGEFSTPGIMSMVDPGSTPSQKSEDARNSPLPNLFGRTVKEEEEEAKAKAHTQAQAQAQAQIQAQAQAQEDSAEGENDSARNMGIKGMCQVQGCSCDLTGLRDYHLRYKICEHHLKLSYIMRDGKPQRFCQQCGRFHLLSEFDGNKRSCRARLQRHNARRRKRPEAEEAVSAAGQGAAAAGKRTKAAAVLDFGAAEPGQPAGLAPQFLFQMSKQPSMGGDEPGEHVQGQGGNPGAEQSPQLNLSRQSSLENIPSVEAEGIEQATKPVGIDKGTSQGEIPKTSWGLQILADVAQKDVTKAREQQAQAQALEQQALGAAQPAVGANGKAPPNWGPKVRRSGVGSVRKEAREWSSSEEEGGASGGAAPQGAVREWPERAQGVYLPARSDSLTAMLRKEQAVGRTAA